MSDKMNVLKIMGIGIISLFLLGCSEEQLLLSEETTEIVEESMVPSSDIEEVMEEVKNEDENGNENSVSGAPPIVLEPVLIAVHVCGAVKQPGVYFLEEGTRIVDAITMAGGFREEADEEYVNQALLLQDGIKVDIPTKEEVENGSVKSQENEALYGLQADSSVVREQGKIDLNTAEEAVLCTLPGIGESRAKSIIAYRDTHGPFEKIEDVMKVSGIKEAAFEKIKDKIIVSR